jgi:hypothetical protein
MKPSANICKKLAATLLLPLVATCLSPLLAAPVVPAANDEIPKSVFVIPANASEGCDPFFPDSIRVYTLVHEQANAHESPVTSLQVKSIMGAAPRYFAIIGTKDYSGGANTFGVGDIEDIISQDGRRLTIHCIKITPNSVLVEVNGQPVPLTYSPGP